VQGRRVVEAIDGRATAARHEVTIKIDGHLNGTMADPVTGVPEALPVPKLPSFRMEKRPSASGSPNIGEARPVVIAMEQLLAASNPDQRFFV
jgi:hypothetical protein